MNTSIHQLTDPDFYELVHATVAEAGGDPTWLTLEISGKVFHHRTGVVLRRLESLKDLGVKICVDDFGAGHWPRGYLGSGLIDMVKIDKSFVDGVGRDHRSTVVRALLRLARTFGVTSVAMGVEARCQIRPLLALGCDLAQGYFLSPPLDGLALEAFLVQQGIRCGAGQRRGVCSPPAGEPARPSSPNANSAAGEDRVGDLQGMGDVDCCVPRHDH